MEKNKIDIKKEAKILSLVAKYIENGIIYPDQEQIQMIIDLNNQLYRHCKKNEDIER